MSKRHKGIIYMIIAAFCFALMNMFVRLSGDVPSMQKSFFRNSIAFLFSAYILWKDRIPFKIEKESIGYMLSRAVFGTLGVLCNFYAVDHLALADASMLNKLSPFFAVLFSALFWKEKVTLFQAMAVGGAFAGSLCIIKPTFSNMNLIPSLIGLVGGISAGLAYSMIRKLGELGVKSPLIICFFSGFSSLVTLPNFVFNFHPMEWWQVVCLLLAGLSACGVQFGLTAAYSCAPAREISVYDYSQVIFSAALGFLVFGQLPDWLSWLGYATICVMAVAMFIYNNRRNKK